MIQRNIKLIKIDNFIGGLFPLAALLVVYFERITGSYAAAMLMFSIAGITKTLLEVPTGIFSDKIGRRKTMILATGLFCLTGILWASGGTFESVALLAVGSFLFGVSDAFLSGTDEALMYETMEELGRSDEFDILYSKSGGWNQIGLACAALLAAGITYFFNLTALAWVSTVPMFASLVIAWLYVEPRRTKEQPQATSVKHFIKSFKELLRNKKLRFYALIDIFDDALGMYSHRFESAYFATLIPVWAVNLARLLKQICGTISFFIVPKIKKIGAVKMLFSSMIGSVFVRIIGVGLNNLFSPFIMALTNLFYGTASTANRDILHHEFTPHQRATMGSIVSFFGGIVMAVVMYLFGVLADVFTPQIAVSAAILAKVAIILLSLSILGYKKRRHA